MRVVGEEVVDDTYCSGERVGASAICLLLLINSGNPRSRACVKNERQSDAQLK
jgi:hypothetical protein